MGRRHGGMYAFTHLQRQHFTDIFVFFTHTQLCLSLRDFTDSAAIYIKIHAHNNICGST